jgi:hypothetical protein
MQRAQLSELFWNAPHVFEGVRAVDPLGFDALREAMSNVLVPYLTGATRHAEHYVAVLVGLRWAKSRATNPIDREIWPRFARFERGLKQYWHRRPSGRLARNRYLGKRRIKEICDGPRPDVDAPILQDQRAIGLLANYIESLRAIGLVRPGQLLIEDSAVSELLGDPRFEWAGTSPGRWDALERTFKSVDTPTAWPRLGRRLFDSDGLADGRVRMYAAARAVVAQPGARAWTPLARSRHLLAPQQAIAAGTAVTTELEERLRAQFAVLLRGDAPARGALTSKRVRALAATLLRLRVIDNAWPADPALASVLRHQLESLAAVHGSPQGLLLWHEEVVRTRGAESWIRELGERSSLELPPQRVEPDFRFGNLQTLLAETKWRS